MSTLYRILSGFILLAAAATAQEELRISYNNSDLRVDLGVGLWAWPMPIDWDGDGDLDLIVSCPDVPYNGIYFFENTGDDPKMPTFNPGVRIGDALKYAQVSWVDGAPRILNQAEESIDPLTQGFFETRPVYPEAMIHESAKTRANQWRYLDYDGDSAVDLIVGIGDWEDYGWDNAFDAEGNWTRGPLHGYVYLIRNAGSTESPDYEAPVMIEAAGQPIDVFGMPSPNFADFDGDGDLDLICGEFLDGFTYFQNYGTRRVPVYAAGKRLAVGPDAIRLDLQMITPTAIDWDGDGDVDLISGDEDGRVAFIENTSQTLEGMPQFLQPKYFQQVADRVKFGALVTPVSVDWDDDGDEDIIAGNTAGYVGFIENLSGGEDPQWAAPVRLKAEGQTLRIQAGSTGSIQGPAEAKWGYTTIAVADWDHDGLLDIVANSIWGNVVWYRNVGSKREPELGRAMPLEVAWDGPALKPEWNWWTPEGNELATQWRTTPMVLDLNEDELKDLVMLDHEGYLAWFARAESDSGLVLQPGQRIFRDEAGEPLRLNDGIAGKSGRRKLAMVDWDQDGDLDLLANSASIDLWLNVSTEGSPWTFRNEGPMIPQKLAGHTTSPTVTDWNGDGIPELLIGAEDGFLYRVQREQ